MNKKKLNLTFESHNCIKFVEMKIVIDKTQMDVVEIYRRYVRTAYYIRFVDWNHVKRIDVYECWMFQSSCSSGCLCVYDGYDIFTSTLICYSYEEHFIENWNCVCMCDLCENGFIQIESIIQRWCHVQDAI